jgi:hypothetical protein
MKGEVDCLTAWPGLVAILLKHVSKKNNLKKVHCAGG